jgi:hypothetical protein
MGDPVAVDISPGGNQIDETRSHSWPWKLGALARRWWKGLVAIFVLWVMAAGALFAVMRQPPETFGRVMAKLSSPVVFLAFPFETLWTKARAGTLNPGDPAPDFSLLKLDKSQRVQLSALIAQQPVVLVFGSYT